MLYRLAAVTERKKCGVYSSALLHLRHVFRDVFLAWVRAAKQSGPRTAFSRVVTDPVV